MKFDFKLKVITGLIILLSTYYIINLDRCSPWEACGKSASLKSPSIEDIIELNQDRE